MQSGPGVGVDKAEAKFDFQKDKKKICLSQLALNCYFTSSDDQLNQTYPEL